MKTTYEAVMCSLEEMHWIAFLVASAYLQRIRFLAMMEEGTAEMKANMMKQ